MHSQAYIVTRTIIRATVYILAALTILAGIRLLATILAALQ